MKWLSTDLGDWSSLVLICCYTSSLVLSRFGSQLLVFNFYSSSIYIYIIYILYVFRFFSLFQSWFAEKEADFVGYLFSRFDTFSFSTVFEFFFIIFIYIHTKMGLGTTIFVSREGPSKSLSKDPSSIQGWNDKQLLLCNEDGLVTNKSWESIQLNLLIIRASRISWMNEDSSHYQKYDF